jgi:hypothetical protein
MLVAVVICSHLPFDPRIEGYPSDTPAELDIFAQADQIEAFVFTNRPPVPA